jgi:WhiB family transcriptional regulator, redox-sensing transcriptional regulator
MEGTVLVTDSEVRGEGMSGRGTLDAMVAGEAADGSAPDDRWTRLPERRSARNAARIPPVAQLKLGWQERAACQGSDARLFFGPEKERVRDRETREGAAKGICASCPVLRDCRSHALQTPELFGVWGGLSETDRESHFGRSFGRRIPRPRSVAA